jgi:hypothetical protein
VDLQLYARVLWRFRFLVAVGLLLGIALAFVSYVKISSNGLEYRQQEEWLSRATLLVTQKGSPEFRTGADPNDPQAYDSGRLAALAALYAPLIDSDSVRALMAPKRPPIGRVVTSPVTTEDGLSLPLITLEALSSTPEGAVHLAQLYSTSFIQYLRDRQSADDIPDDQRVQVAVVSQPSPPFVFTPRSKTVPIVILLSVLAATVALVFLLENLRPRGPRRDVRDTGMQARSAA